MKRAGVEDSYERARYFDAVVTYHGPASSGSASRGVSAHRPENGRVPRTAGMKFKYADGWSDYYDDLPGRPAAGPLAGGANCSTSTNSASGSDRLSTYPGIGAAAGLRGLPDAVPREDAPGRQAMAMRLLRRMLKNKLIGSDVRGGGAAIQGRMLQIALREDLPIHAGDAGARFRGRERPSDGVSSRVREAARCASRPVDGVLINCRRLLAQPRNARAIPAETQSVAMDQCQSRRHRRNDRGGDARSAQPSTAWNEAWWVMTSLGAGETLPEGAVSRRRRRRCRSCTTSTSRCRT